MTFVDEVSVFLKDNPAGTWELPGEFKCVMVETEVHDERRWAVIKHSVFERKGEFVLVEHAEPATELQEDIEDEYPPEVFAVEPYVVEVVKYRPV